MAGLATSLIARGLRSAIAVMRIGIHDVDIAAHKIFREAICFACDIHDIVA